ncbi:CotH kinase family protein [Saccharicrinis sp. FJH62]|uniref:CotH kinase family protein n=1 Tax=Saccharicrinis sp. FJH62 TaxID=3344657 RepID=UPI0035D4D4AB
MKPEQIHTRFTWFPFGVTVMLCFFMGQGISSQDFVQVNIEIEQDSIDELESHPYTNEDVHGNFTADDLRIDNVEIHYRGAYYLYTLMQQGDFRNWKIKTSKLNRYNNRREWNFNYELNLRQRLAYLLMDAAGVPCVTAQHVILSVNGKRQGVYLQYEDPDNKRWLTDTFGDNDGDLYKAAYDMPDEIKYFADLTFLGNAYSDYFLHYRKQTNNNDEEEFDYSSIRDFTYLINYTPEDQFAEMIRRNFDVDAFLKYLVVANFMAHWDGYPFRPKNYFLYQTPNDKMWHFIPWDMDATFQRSGHFNSIGTNGSVFHYFDGYEPYNKVEGEPVERPLVWNMMKDSLIRNQYIATYKSALNSYLGKDFLNATLDSLWLGIRNNVSRYESSTFHNDMDDMKSFIDDRLGNVTAELSEYDVHTGYKSPVLTGGINNLLVYPNPSFGPVHVRYSSENKNSRITLYDMTGKAIFRSIHQGHSVDEIVDPEQYPKGIYMLVITSGKDLMRVKITLK